MPELQAATHPSGDVASWPTAREEFVSLSNGEFRTLHWDGTGRPVLLLHGLSGVAEVWLPTVAALTGARPVVALDQRWHGQSNPRDGRRVDAAAFVQDTVELVRALSLEGCDLAGHSMGARVAIVLASRHGSLFRSTAVVDIGPEAWKANWQETVTAFDSLPPGFADRDAALAFAGARRPLDPAGQAVFLARLRELPSGELTWRANMEKLKAVVRNHRSRDFWEEWERISGPLMLVRGERSGELRPRIAAMMRERNPSVRFREIPEVGHNIPLQAPERLAAVLEEFWWRLPADGVAR